ncbi:hypothetical protein H6503_01320 [Candidatus Woesearchaeota archaeon]|nr:hypothetical protein [Candidatus Woesearchaeota archaeon]
MSLSEKKVEHLKKMPLIQTRIRRVQDSNLILHQTIISDIRPIEYYEAVVDKTNGRMETKVDSLMEEIII